MEATNSRVKLDPTRNSRNTAMEDLPPETICCILSRLPVKSLLCFKLVSTIWYRLADGDELYKNPPLIMHFKDGNLKDGLYLIEGRNYLTGDYSVSHLKMPILLDEYTNVESLHSLRGLLCIIYNKTNLHQYMGCRICIHNPLTGEIKNLPPTTELDSNSYHFVYGFGFNPISKEYKVVRAVSKIVCEDLPFHGQRTEVLTLGTTKWRQIYSPPCRIFQPHSAVSCHGTVNWVGEDDNHEPVVISLNLLDENFSLFKLPVYVDTKYMLSISLAVLGGNLLVVVLGANGFHIWRMREHGVEESWDEQFSWNNLFNICRKVDLLYMFPNGELLVLYDKKQVFWFHPNTRIMKFLDFKGVQKDKFQIVTLAASLQSP